MEFSARLICYYKVSSRAFQYKWEWEDGEIMVESHNFSKFILVNFWKHEIQIKAIPYWKAYL